MIERARAADPWPWLQIVLAGVVPFLSDVARNLQLFTPEQIVSSAATVVLATSAVYGLALLLLRRVAPVLTGTARASGAGLERGLFSFAAAAVLALFLYDSNMAELQQALGRSVWAAVVVVVLFVVYWGVSAGLGPRLSCLVLASLLGGRLVLTGLAVSAAPRDGVDLSSRAQRRAHEGVRLARRPNIYFFCLESYHGPAAMKELYGRGDAEFLDFLGSNGFVVSEPILSNYWHTMASLQSFFLMDHHYAAAAFGNEDLLHARGFVSGTGPFYNPVLSILKRNGYTIAYLLPTDYCYRPGAGLVDVSLLRRSWPFAPLKTSLPGLLGREPETYVPSYERRASETIASWPEGRPGFFFLKLGAEHTLRHYDYRTDREEFAKRYWRSIRSANRSIEALCRQVIAKDPEGIIILAGDHGAWSYKSAGGFLSAVRDGIPPDRLVRDVHDVLLAIRWGDGLGPEPYPFRSLANVMRFVFFRLGGGDSLLAGAARDDSYVREPDGTLYRTSEDGRALTRWQAVPPGGR